MALDRYKNAMESPVAADFLVKLIRKSRLKAVYTCGKDARQMKFLQRWLPDFFEKSILKKYGF
jgi:hypothetical protein